MTGTALCVRRNLCWVCDATASPQPGSSASVTIGGAAAGPNPAISASITWLRRYGDNRRADAAAGGSGVALDPGDAAELDAFLGQRPRLLVARLAIDAVGIDLTVMD